MVFPLPPHPSFASQMPPSPLWGEGLRAATRGRPCENFGPFLPVGADLCVRPRFGRTHRCAPTRRRGQLPPYMASPSQGEAVNRKAD